MCFFCQFSSTWCLWLSTKTHCLANETECRWQSAAVNGPVPTSNVLWPNQLNLFLLCYTSKALMLAARGFLELGPLAKQRALSHKGVGGRCAFIEDCRPSRKVCRRGKTWSENSWMKLNICSLFKFRGSLPFQKSQGCWGCGRHPNMRASKWASLCAQALLRPPLRNCWTRLDRDGLNSVWMCIMWIRFKCHLTW